tara:strand:- start:1029 stop:1532 length:504 start_codon:yes stop_codon:yes gene_type:complete
MKRLIFTGIALFLSLAISNDALAANINMYTNILKKLDGLACTAPEKLPAFYGKNLVIMVDDKRALLANRVKDYRQMISDFRDMKCQVQRQVLTGHAGNKVGYVLVDEIISITSKSNDTDERQHSVCNYNFVKEGSNWKITLEHCSSLPDYSIGPADDALYYFHNPLY